MCQTSKTCWTGTQDLLLRPASFASSFSENPRRQAHSTTGCIPKTFLLRDIPTPCLIASLISFEFSDFFQSGFFMFFNSSSEQHGNSDLALLGSCKKKASRSKTWNYAEPLKGRALTDSRHTPGWLEMRHPVLTGAR